MTFNAFQEYARDNGMSIVEAIEKEANSALAERAKKKGYLKQEGKN